MRLNLEDNCTFINGGSWTASEYADSGYPVLKVSNFDKATISYNDLSYLQESSFDKYKKNQLKLHDIVIATVGSHPSLVNSAAGRCITVPKDAVGLLLNQNALCLRSKNENVIDQRYLGYLCKSQLFQHFIQQRGKGAANQMRIPIGGIKSFEMDFPEIETQRKIASILSAYDDLIENNLKRIKLLEEQAQQTYEEWFVRFKFPGYENVEFDEESGLPVGWEKVKVRNYVSIISKGPSLKYESNEQKFPVLNQSCIRNGGIELEKVLYAKELSENQKECYLKMNDILINSMGQGTLGRVSKNIAIDKKFIIHNCITFLRAKDKYSQYMLFYFISRRKPYFESIAQGSTGQSTLRKELVSNLKLNLPSNEILNAFDVIVSPRWKKAGILKNQNQHLKEARDILLPRLMSGMINVAGLEVDEQLGMVAEERETYKKK